MHFQQGSTPDSPKQGSSGALLVNQIKLAGTINASRRFPVKGELKHAAAELSAT
jgi:hypothetical protein